MAEYLSPGVYVEEVDRGPRPIQGVGTAMPVFIGFSEKAEEVEQIDGEMVVSSLLGQPQLIMNWSQYVERFGDFVSGAYLPHSVYGYFQNGGTRCYVVSVRQIPKASTNLLNAAGNVALIAKAKRAGLAGLDLRVSVKLQTSSSLQNERDDEDGTWDGEVEESLMEESLMEESFVEDSFFDVIVEKKTPSGKWRAAETLRKVELKSSSNGSQKAYVAYKKKSQLIDLLIPDATAPLSQLHPTEVAGQALGISEKSLLQAPTTKEFQGNVTERQGLEGLEAIEDITMVCVPDLMTPLNGKLDLDMIQAVQTNMIAHCERMGDRVAILDAPPSLKSNTPKAPDSKPHEILNWRVNTTSYDSSYAALYYPWLQVNDPVTNRPIYVPPSGHVAGVWARNDNTRGVHKAPANEVILGTTGLAYNPTKAEQDILNPQNINCIRQFPGRGIRVWGARTLSSNPAWRYLNVRRLFNYVEKSIELNTQWVVFEPNDHQLWAKVRRDIKAFLTTVWRTGALFGQSPSEAFYIKCDEELNPPESRDLGRLIIEIGMAPVKPAEFVIFRISQWAGPNAEA